ncbi:hypothetical protein PIB30_016367 [Stylosanthes scabra]|uniref:Uncharacterized protein n=1 Tax=Stylosanthes scabra TaxID=79078 RepID=A0ABU6T7L6_9FABA|nr:hypothetical protein [Stylosanthes scabra]
MVRPVKPRTGAKSDSSPSHLHHRRSFQFVSGDISSFSLVTSSTTSCLPFVAFLAFLGSASPFPPEGCQEAM